MTKFKYIGSSHPYGVKNLDLAVYKIVDAKETFKNGDIIDIPDTEVNKSLIGRMDVDGNFERVAESNKTFKKPKKGDD